MNKYFNDALEFLINLASIESVKAPATESAPFGIEIDNALNYVLETASMLGFKVTNYDGYIGEITWGEHNPFAVLCHLDVVPAGNLSDWKFYPFTATVDRGQIYGRGVVDDKGPLAATLFALKKLKDEGFQPKRGIKFILGCDEESGWGCINHYKKIASMPLDGFSPDACFPVIFAEKGIFQAKFKFDFDRSKLRSFCGGVAANVVCGYASIEGEINKALISKLGLNLNGNKIESHGKTAHASEPHEGISAISPLISYLVEINAVNSTIAELILTDSLKLREIIDETGPLTLTTTMVTIENEKLELTIDMRYPCTIDFGEILKKLKAKYEFEVLAHKQPLYNDKNSPLIQTLLKVYNKHTGNNAVPVAIGGGTYARALKLGAGFGPEEGISTAHQPDERLSLKTFESLIDIYHDAIKEVSVLE